MKNKKFFVVATGIFCLVFCLFLPFYFGIQFLLPILSPEESSAEVSEDVLTPDECSPLEAWKLCEEALLAVGDFSATTEGVSNTQVLFFNYNQQINNKRIISGNTVFSQNMNTGTLLNAGLQQYFDGTKAYLRPCQLMGTNHLSWAETPSVVSMNAYYNAFGSVSDGLSAFLINDRTLTDSLYLYENNGVYTFSYVLSQEAAVYYAKSLQTLCQLDTPPNFNSIELTLEMDEQFRPIRIKYKEEYTISVDLIGETVCKSQYVETFQYESEDQSQLDYFAQFSDLAPDNTIPTLSTGYNFLFSLFGNTNSYDATLFLSTEEIPLMISLDTNNESIYAVGDKFSFVLADGNYYFDYNGNKLRSKTGAFNSKISPLMSIGSNSANNSGSNGNGGNSGGDFSYDSLLSDVNMKTEQGKLIVSSASEEFAFSVTLNTESMVVEKVSVDIFFSGEKATLTMQQSHARGESPSLVGYTDITHALDSLDILLELATQPNTYYHVTLEGEQVLEADVMLTLGDAITIYAKPMIDNFPVDLFYKENSLVAVYRDISINGTLSDFEELLAHFGSGQSIPPFATLSSGTNESAPFKISTSGNNLILEFGECLAQKLTFGGSYCLYSDGTSNIHITKTGHGSEAAKEAPTTKHSLEAHTLSSFLEGSVYPALLRAETIYANLDIRSPEGRFNVDAVLSVNPEMVIKLNTTFYEQPLELYYKNDTVFLSHDLFNAYIAANKLGSLSGSLPLTTGVYNTIGAQSPSDTFTEILGEEELQSISVEADQIKLEFETQTLFLSKDSFRLVGVGTSVRSTSLWCTEEAITLSVPDKVDCIDLEDLLHKLNCLNEQTRFAFTGNYSDDMVSAVISRLDVQLTADKDISKLVAEAVVSSTISQLVKLHYDDKNIYLDVAGIKVFANKQSFLSSPGSIDGVQDDNLETLIGGLIGGDLLDFLSSIKSISYANETLHVITEEAQITLGWNGDRFNLLRYKTSSANLLLASCEQQPIHMPSPEEYTDVSAYGSLAKAVWNTSNAGSFQFNGQIDLKLFSYTIENITASGSVFTKDGSLSANLFFTVPYVPGVSSVNIPSTYQDKTLQDCTIVNRVIIYDGVIYIKKEIYGEYGSNPAKILVITEQRYITLQDFQNDPTDTLSFLFNLENDLTADIVPVMPTEAEQQMAIPDPLFAQTPFDAVYQEGEYTVIQISNRYLPNPDDEMRFMLFADDRYINKLSVIAQISAFTIEGTVDIFDHGNATVKIPSMNELAEYLPLQK